MPLKTTCTLKRTRNFVRRCSAVALLVAIGWSAYGCGDTASIPDGPGVRLASLGISPGALSPAFSPTTTNYTVNVPSTVASVTVTAIPEDSTTSITIAGATTRSLSIDLNSPGSSKDITIALTAQSGSQSTYTIGVNRALPLSDNNDLSALTVTPGALSPPFAPGQQTYTVEVPFNVNVTSVTISATKSDPNAVMSGSVTAGIGTATGQATLPVSGPGTTTQVSITVTAPNGSSKTYTISVNRQKPSTDANLFALTVSAGSLVPSFSSGIPNYSADVASAVDSITVTATKSDPNAVMSALGSIIARSGDPTGSVTVPLGLGTSTPIAITVTAQDAVTTKTYTITVDRPFR